MMDWTEKDQKKCEHVAVFPDDTRANYLKALVYAIDVYHLTDEQIRAVEAGCCVKCGEAIF